MEVFRIILILNKYSDTTYIFILYFIYLFKKKTNIKYKNKIHALVKLSFSQ
jgi:hypothetical protein